MAYSSSTNILSLLPSLPNTTTVTGVISSHITRADALIDAKIGRRYSVPLSPTPPLLGSLSEDITVYYTYRSFYTQDNTNRSDYFGELKDEALKTLDEIRDGKIDLVNTAGSLIEERTTESTSGVLDSTTKDNAPFFDIDDELNWKFNDELLDDVADHR